ncbi:MAG TPA: tetratricopeptide repeat protein [Tepidisphaeraceae bacterium]|jgi:tetratricopeptide (TPR) repeat protein|nr:tetratricopeptide repeat protein [Tepidisphaeraceae bacterium]
MPGDPPFINKLEAAKAVAAQNVEHLYMAGAAPALPVMRQKPPRTLPARSDKFVGRTTEIAEIHARLNGSLIVGVTQQAAAHGDGGVGKTSIAIEYAWQHLSDYPGGLFFISAEVPSLMQAIAELAPHLGIPDRERPEETARAVKDHLEAGEPSLLILDNVHNRDHLAAAGALHCLPCGGCRRLITTRSHDLLDASHMMPVERLPRDIGIALLGKYRPDAALPENRQVVGDIVDWFDGWAVGLTVVGVYMALPKHRSIQWSAYATSLSEKGLGVVRATEQHAGAIPDYNRRIDSVFDDLLASLQPEERRALEYAALLPGDVVVKPWLLSLLEGDGIALPAAPGAEANPAGPVVENLLARGLLRPAGERSDNIFTLHRVLRHRLREMLDGQPDKKQILLNQIVALAELRGKASHQGITDKSIRWELAPLLALSSELILHGRQIDAINLANWVILPLRDLARYAEGKASLERFAEDASNEKLGVDSAILLSNLALILKDLGDLPEALWRMERAIEIWEKHFEADHPTLATYYSNLALILQALGDLPEAHWRMERAIEIWEKHFEADHPTLATSYSNLASILKELGDLPEARRRMERAIEIGEKHFDADHPTLAMSYSNLAMILRGLGDLPEARRRMERAIEIWEKHFEADHPTLATCYSNLALILQALGDLPEAHWRMERVIEIWEKHFDADHPTLATSYWNLASIEIAQNNRPRACDLFRKAHAIWLKHFSENDSRTQMAARAIAQHCGGAKPSG